MSCTFQGRALKGKAEFGSFGLSGNELSFSVSTLGTVDGQAVSVSSGLSKLVLKTGRQDMPSADTPGVPHGGKLEFEKPNGDLERKYWGGMELLYFATAPSDERLRIRYDLATAVRTASPMAGFAHVRVAGRMNFEAAFAPDTLSDSCSKEWAPHMLEARWPRYNAAVCGAEEVAVSCTFDVDADVLASD